MNRILYACTHCGRDIFAEEHIIKRTNLWDLTDYQAEAYMLRDVIDMEGLRRYDCSLHQGWYCCRFIAMRMLEDKFGTGDALLVYVDSVAPHAEGEPAIKGPVAKGQIKLTARDFDDVLAQKDDVLKVVKFGGIWCPPCRLSDAVIAEIVQENTLPDVAFFEVDIDEESALAARFHNRSIPYFRFYFHGAHIALESTTHVIVDGGLVGGLTRYEMEWICSAVLRAASQGEKTVLLSEPSHQ